ncbi:transposase family protein [Streptomyces sp. NPDC012623]|uniref:helix-turn-helix domain-containing protein n=1 Tax=unclassified Streptomyces TaxID=2593676 RepID=UPI0036949D9A
MIKKHVRTAFSPPYELAFTDRVLAALVHLRTGLTDEALAVIYEVGSSTIGRAINEIRPLLAERGFAVPDRPGLRLRTPADVFAYAGAENVTLRIDGTRNPGVTSASAPSRTAGVRLRQAQTEHHQDHHDQRPAGAHPVLRRRAARPHVRPDRDPQSHPPSRTPGGYTRYRSRGSPLVSESS